VGESLGFESDSETEIDREVFSEMIAERRAYYKKGETLNAERFYRSAHRLMDKLHLLNQSPEEYHSTLFDLAWILCMSGKENEARMVLEIVIEQVLIWPTEPFFDGPSWIAILNMNASFMRSRIHLILGELEAAELVCRQVMQATRRLEGKDSAAYLECVILMVHTCEAKEDFELATAYRKLIGQKMCPLIRYHDFAPSWTRTPALEGIASSFSAADATEPDGNQEHLFASSVPSLGGTCEVKHASSAQHTEVNANSDARDTTAKHSQRTFLSARETVQVQIPRFSFTPKEHRPVIRTPKETELKSQATGNTSRPTTTSRLNPPMPESDVKSYYQDTRVAYISSQTVKGALLKTPYFQSSTRDSDPGKVTDLMSRLKRRWIYSNFILITNFVDITFNPYRPSHRR
jgi:hypothetical protein